MSFARSFSCQQLLNDEEDTNQKDQTGGGSNLSYYLLLYLYFKNCVKVGRWEREERGDDRSLWWCWSYSDEDPHSDGRTLNVCTCCILIHTLPWYRRSWGLEKGQSFPDFSGSATSIWVVFVVHVNMFTVTGHSPLISIGLFLLFYLFKSFISSKHVLLLYLNYFN